jgi:hypothetical protein
MNDVLAYALIAAAALVVIVTSFHAITGWHA